MNGFILSSSIEKNSYDRKIIVEENGQKILTINILSGKNFNELSFQVSSFIGLWIHFSKIASIFKGMNDNTVITECLNREYVLRIWLFFIGFKKKVTLPNYYNIRGKKYSCLILEL
ncbi:MAG: hypothetical protein RR623_06465 [Bacilli bacterium]|uniref:Uncharacterized protein n=1 Tax=Carnobacterium maltaromaticum TaxID=2751 RepID=A0AAW9K124_CARML|nr:hypothetical protein [Carnobacterium maltaromaticum]MDZ5757482.1 hypothetical protein [Carnobacterium maltaromaticum]